MNRETYNPGDATCGDCGGPLAFYKLPNGKWCPCNPDGTDHWDDCREFQIKGTYGIQRDFRLSQGGAHTIAKHHSEDFYSGEKPPWEYDGPIIYCVRSEQHLRLILSDTNHIKTTLPDSYRTWTDGRREKLR